MEYKDRRNKLIASLENNSISLIYSGEEIKKSSDQFYPFCVNNNFYYLTGLKEKNMILLIYKRNNMLINYLFIEESDPITSLWTGEKMSKEEILEISDFEINDIYYLSDFPRIFDTLSFNKTLYEDKSISIKHSNSIDCSKFIYEMRLIKTLNEIENVKKAIDITKEAIYSMFKNSKPNMYEYQLESFYDQKLKYNNTIPSFKSIIASGKNAAILHYEDNNEVMENNTLVLCDVGCYYNQYSSDITRTFPINGKFTERQKQIYEIVLKANKESIKYIKPGITYQEFHDFGKEILIEELKKIKLIRNDSDIYKFFYHSLGHSLGLDVHDPGNLKTVLREGMLITVEPGLYIKDENIGIRIEDDVYLTKEGAINLSEHIIKEVKDIENYMSSHNDY